METTTAVVGSTFISDFFLKNWTTVLIKFKEERVWNWCKEAYNHFWQEMDERSLLVHIPLICFWNIPSLVSFHLNFCYNCMKVSLFLLMEKAGLWVRSHTFFPSVFLPCPIDTEVGPWWLFTAKCIQSTDLTYYIVVTQEDFFCGVGWGEDLHSWPLPASKSKPLQASVL